MSHQIIALSGPRCCGKSTIAKHLENNHGYTRSAFADSLREIAKLAGDDKVDDRIYLAELGEKLRELNPEFIIEVVHQKILNSDSPVVIEDVRFLEELEFCQDISATTFRLNIPESEQHKRLANRDGIEGVAAIELFQCNDETILSEVKGWDFIFDAIGDFSELASNFHLLSTLNNERILEVMI
jgi:dephospho-CoA kinase